MDVASKDSRMLGKATLTMVASRNARNAPEQATSRTCPCGTRPVPSSGAVPAVRLRIPAPTSATRRRAAASVTHEIG